MSSLQYPIGTLEIPSEINLDLLQEWIQILAEFPKRLSQLVESLNDEQLDTPYRPEGWTVRQVVHHCADSHHHSYIRFKWALTENNPTIKAYNEQTWAELLDTKTAPISLSLDHLKAVHAKLVYLLKGLTESDFNRSFVHPETMRTILLKENVGIYAWHCSHHYAHIEQLLIRKGWK